MAQLMDGAIGQLLGLGSCFLEVERDRKGFISRISRISWQADPTDGLEDLGAGPIVKAARRLLARAQQPIAGLNACEYCGTPSTRAFGACSQCGARLPLLVPLDAEAHGVD